MNENGHLLIASSILKRKTFYYFACVSFNRYDILLFEKMKNENCHCFMLEFANLSFDSETSSKAKFMQMAQRDATFNDSYWIRGGSISILFCTTKKLILLILKYKVMHIYYLFIHLRAFFFLRFVYSLAINVRLCIPTFTIERYIIYNNLSFRHNILISFLSIAPMALQLG